MACEREEDRVVTVFVADVLFSLSVLEARKGPLEHRYSMAMHAVSSAGHQQWFLSFYLLTCTEEHLQGLGWPLATACECQ